MLIVIVVVRGIVRSSMTLRDLLSYLCFPLEWCDTVVSAVHNTRSLDTQLILNRAILLKRLPEMIMRVLKVLCMRVHHLTFVDSACYLEMQLRKFLEA
jgi:hypothetical protein